MFGRASQTNDLQQETAFEPESYQAHLKHKMEEIKSFVKTKVAISAKRQEENYDCQATSAPLVQVTPSGCQYQMQEN